MARLTFDAVKTQATANGKELVKLSRGYKFENSDYTFKTLADVVEFLNFVETVEDLNPVQVAEVESGMSLEDSLQPSEVNPVVEASEVNPVVEASEVNPVVEAYPGIPENDLIFTGVVIDSQNYEISEANLEERYIQDLKANDIFWQNWEISYKEAIAKLKPVAKTEEKTEEKAVDSGLNHDEVGIIFCLLLTVFFQALGATIKMVVNSKAVRVAAKRVKSYVSRPINNPFKFPYGVSW
jgi:hypothetical protein